MCCHPCLAVVGMWITPSQSVHNLMPVGRCLLVKTIQRYITIRLLLYLDCLQCAVVVSVCILSLSLSTQVCGYISVHGYYSDHANLCRFVERCSISW